MESVKELVEKSMSQNIPISELMIQEECATSGASRQEVWDKMEKQPRNDAGRCKTRVNG